MANRIEDAGVKEVHEFRYNGTDYRVYETRTKRSQDVFRFECWKEGSHKPYVVSFQDHHGSSSGCDCPAGKFQRAKGECKHVKMVRSEFLAGARVSNAAKRAPDKALPAKATKSPVAALEAALEAKRSDYRRCKAMLDKARENVAKLEAELEATEKAGKAAKVALEKAQNGGQKSLPF